MKPRFLFFTLFLAACVSSPGTSVATPSSFVASGAVPATPEAAAYTLNQVITSLSGPLYLTHAGDGSGRLFIVEQAGRILIWQNGAVLPDPFLNLTGSVSTFLEQGLLGLAFDPNYETTGYFWINYTDLDGDTVIARYTVSAADPNRADPESALMILQVDQPYPNHNGGQLAFGPDGFLYIGLGDGGWFGDPQGNGQKLGTLLGKILRLDVTGLYP
ncbi:MAG: PQQ-dependent sugar dehydrogenase, partial [Chloroflexi bacterium]|nr:PQQ-dependent sugar dehydrogenase [Chloroflexota bacterium]